MPDRNRYDPPIPREDENEDEEKRSFPPARAEDRRPVTFSQMEQFVNHAIASANRPLLAILRRLETESVEARKERLRRKKIEDELYEREKRELELGLMRAKLDSQNDERELIKARAASLERPATPVQFVPFQLPPHESSSPSEPPKRSYNRTHVIAAIIAAISAVAVAAIGAYASNHGAPHGAIVNVPPGH